MTEEARHACNTYGFWKVSLWLIIMPYDIPANDMKAIARNLLQESDLAFALYSLKEDAYKISRTVSISKVK